jgi:hypothetical protein
MRQLRELARTPALSMRFPTDVRLAPLTLLAVSSRAPDRNKTMIWEALGLRARTLGFGQGAVSPFLLSVSVPVTSSPMAVVAQSP